MLEMALKEWAIVCDLLRDGELALLLRKGGISEVGGAGVFELEHERFALFRAWEHQKREMLKPAYRERGVLDETEPAEIVIDAYAEVGKIWRVVSRESVEALDDLHCWSAAQLDMRFGYKPERPLYLMALRVYRLRAAKRVAQHAAYRGCRSWVPLRGGDRIAGADLAGAVSAICDDRFAELIVRLDGVMDGGGV